MTTVSRNLEITVNRQQAISDLRAIDAAFGRLGRNATSGSGGLSSLNNQFGNLTNNVANNNRVMGSHVAATRAAASAQQAAAVAMSQLTAQLGQATAAMSAAAASMNNVGNQATATAAKVNTASTAMTGFHRAATVITAGALVAGYAFVKLADGFDLARSKIALTSASTQEFAQAWKNVQQITIQTRGDLGATAALYSKINFQSQALKLTQDQVAEATRVWGMSLKVSGSNAQMAEAATTQLAQALGSGVLQGDEFKSITENNSAAMGLFAAALNVSRGELKKMAAEGEITAEMIIKGLADPAITARIKEQFKTIPATFGDMFQGIKTVTEVGVGEFKRAFMAGVSLGDVANFSDILKQYTPAIHEFGFAMRDAWDAAKTAASAAWVVVGPVVTTLAANLDLVVYGLAAVVAGSVAVKAVNLAGTLLSSAAAAFTYVTGIGGAAATTSLLSTATGAYSRVLKVATGVQMAFNIVAAMNPYVLIAAAVVAAGAALYAFSDSITVSSDGLVTLGDLVEGVWMTIKEGAAAIAGAFDGVFDGLAGAWDSIKSGAGDAFDWAKEKGSAFLDGVVSNIGPSLLAAGGIGGAAIMGIADAAGISGATIKTITGTVTDYMGQAFTGAAGKSVTAMGAIERVSYKVFAGIGRGLDLVVKYLSGAMAGMKAALSNMMVGLGNGVVGLVNRAIDFGVKSLNVLIDLANKVSGVFGGEAFSKVGSMSIGDFGKGQDVGAAFNSGFNGVGPVFENMLGGLGAQIGEWGDTLVNKVTGNARKASEERRAGEAASAREMADPTVGNDKNPGGAPTAGDDKGGKGKKGGAADDAAKAAKEAEKRAQALADFWKGFERETEAAKLTGIELANHNKLLEYKKIIGAENLANDHASLESARAQINEKNRLLSTAKAITAATKQATDEEAKHTDMKRLQALIAEKGFEKGTEAFNLEKERAAFTRQAMVDGVDLNNKDLKQQMDKRDALADQTKQLEEQNKLLSDRITRGGKYAADADAKANPYRAAQLQNNTLLADLQAWKDEEMKKGTLNAEEIDRIHKAGTDQAATDFAEAIYQAGQGFRDSVDKVASGLESLFGKKAGGAFRGLGGLVDIFRQGKDAFTSGAVGANSSGGLAQVLSGSKDILGNLSSTLAKSMPKLSKSLGSLGDSLGQMSSGAAIGSMVAPLGKMLWSKFSSTGAQVGGAIGSFAGPLGSLAGSILGGTIGGLLKKSKKASQQFAFDSSGKLVAGNLTGNSAKFKAGASGAGDNVIGGLYSIAQKLGADLSSINMASIGIRDGKWRVDADGSGDTKKKKGAIDFGKDGEAAAVEYVIRDALKKGVLTGMSEFSTRIVRVGTDAMIDLASKYEAMIDDLDRMKNPVTAGIKDITTSIDDMLKSMREAGASAAELGKAEEYRSIKLAQFAKDQLSSLTDFRKTLFGEGSGISKLAQMDNAKADYERLKADKAAGKDVSNDELIEALDLVNNLARSIYGTTTNQYQAVRGFAINETDTMIADVQKEFDNATVQAINQQTNIMNQQTDLLMIQNEYLRQLVANGGVGGAVGSPVYSGNLGLGARRTYNGHELLE